MKTLFYIIFIFCFTSVFGQDRNTTDCNCNEEWLDELIKTDSISDENRAQDYMCFMGIFDSLKNSKKYSKLELLEVIGNLAKYSDGAFSEILFLRSFDFLFSNPDSFFSVMEKSKKETIESWAMMIWMEYTLRSAEEGNYATNILNELHAKMKKKKYSSFYIFEKKLNEIEKNN